MGEVRFCLYFCKELYDAYCEAKMEYDEEIKSLQSVSTDEIQFDENCKKMKKKKGKNNKIENKKSEDENENKNENKPGGAVGVKERALNGILHRIKNSAKPKLLAANVIRAKGLYRQVSVVDKVIDSEANSELEYAGYISTQLNALTEEVLQHVRKTEDKKKIIMDKLTKNSGVSVFCKHCKNETQRHLDYCPTCGKLQVFY